MSESAFTRLWNTVKPPSAGTRPPESAKVVELRRRQRKLVTVAVAAIVLISVGTGVFWYIANAPQRADKEFQEGMKFMSPGKYPDAIVHFTKAISISPQLPNALLERGDAHRVLGEADDALGDYQAAAELNPTLAAAQSGIAMIYVERHDLTHALEHLNKAISMQPSVEAYYERGQILEGQGEHRKAIEDYDRAIAEERDSPYMYRARALAKANLGDDEGAHADRLLATQIERH